MDNQSVVVRSVFLDKQCNLHGNPNFSIVFGKYGNIIFSLEGKYERYYGSSWITYTGSVIFCKEGKYRREGGPSWIGWNGKKEFHYSIPESVIPLLLLEWEKKYEKDF